MSVVFVDPITNHRPTQLPQATRKSSAATKACRVPNGPLPKRGLSLPTARRPKSGNAPDALLSSQLRQSSQSTAALRPSALWDRSCGLRLPRSRARSPTLAPLEIASSNLPAARDLVPLGKLHCACDDATKGESCGHRPPAVVVAAGACTSLDAPTTAGTSDAFSSSGSSSAHSSVTCSSSSSAHSSAACSANPSVSIFTEGWGSFSSCTSMSSRGPSPPPFGADFSPPLVLRRSRKATPAIAAATPVPTEEAMIDAPLVVNAAPSLNQAGKVRLCFDAVLDCYFDPVSGKYYQMDGL